MTTASQYFYLLRWLLFPSTFLSILLALAVVAGGTSLGLHLTDRFALSAMFYSVAVIFYSFLLFNFQARFALLFTRKTMSLTGVLAWRMTMIGLFLVALWSLAVAPALTWVDGSINWAHCLRAATLTLSFLTLLIYIGALTRLNLFLISLVILCVLFWDPDAFSAIAGSAWRQGTAVLYGVLLLLTLALWAALYLRIERARLPKPLGEGVEPSDESRRQSTPPEYSLISWLLPRLKLRDKIRSPESVLLLEATRPALSYLLTALATALPLGLIVAIVVALEDNFTPRYWLAAAVVLIPLAIMLAGTEPIAGNARRLWLIHPGGRGEILKQLERGYARSVIPGIALILAGSVALMTGHRPLWWLLCWAAIVPLAGLLFFYQNLLTVAWDHYLMPLARLTIGLVTIGAIAIFWFAPLPLFSAGLLVVLLVSSLFLRQLGRARWLRMDYSLLSDKVARI